MYVNMLTFFAIYFVPELQIHPFRIFGHMAALEAGYMVSYLHYSKICSWKLNYLLVRSFGA
jgi:hypothetical protein